MTDDAPQTKPDPAKNTGGSTNVNNTTQGGIGIGEGSQITVGQGDITGRDKKAAGGHIIEAAAGATVIIGAVPAAEEEAPAPGEPPFKGLQYFDEKDAEWFFGRELLVAKLVGKLRDNRFLAIVIGASGSGKSSIVRAGVIPALKHGEALADGTLPPQGSTHWPIHITTPTIRPLESLAASLTRDSESVTATTTLMDDLARDSRSLHLAARKALSRNPASHLLVVVDQFEELFTLCKDEAERKAFIDNLITATDPKTDGPTIVIITMRADFYANCAAYSNLREVLSSQQEYIGPMSPAELRRAMEEPAKHGDWEFEEGLVDHLLHEVGISDTDDQPEPGALPLLSHALLETWKRRRGRKMTFRGYEESGGVRGAIAKTADAVYQQLDTHQQSIAKRIFLRLTELGEGQQDTRRRAELSELVPSPEEAATVQLVLKKLVDARLVTTAENSAEVAHEALIREWPTLRDWLAESREGLRIQRQITNAAREWNKEGRETLDLLRSLRLVQALEFERENPGELSQLEREFLAASRAEADRERLEREAARQRELDQAKELAETRKQQLETVEKLAETEKRSAALLRRRAIYLAGAFVVAVIMVLIAAYSSWQNANTSKKNEVLANENIAIAQTAEADRAIALTQEAIAQAASTQAVAEQKRAEEERDRADREAELALLNQLAGEGNGRLSTQFDLALLLSVEGNHISDTVELKGSLLNGLEFSPPLKKFLRGHTAPVTHVAFTPDGKTLISAGNEKDIFFWDVAEQNQSGSPLSSNQDSISSFAVSPDGKLLASGDSAGRVVLWNMTTASPTLLAEFSAGEKTVWALDFSQDNKTLASTSGNAIILWDVSNSQSPAQIGQPLATQSTAEVVTIDFSPTDNTLLASGARFPNTDVLLWNVATQTLIGEFGGQSEDGNPIKHKFGVLSVAFSPDGTLLASGGEDTDVFLWEVTTRQSLVQLDFHLAAVNKVVFSPDGETFASGSADSTIVLWDVSDRDRLGVPVRLLTGHNSTVYDLAFPPNPDSQLLASASADKTVILWDLSVIQPLGKPLRGHKSNSIVRNVTFSPDGKLVASASNDPNVILWDGATGDPIGSPLVGHDLKIGEGDNAPPNQINAVAFSPDSKLLADGGRDGKIVLWDVSDPKNPQRLSVVDAHRDRVWGLVFSLDGKTLFSGSEFSANEDQTIKVWDVSDPQNVKQIGNALTDHTGTVRTVAISHDGTRLASSSADTTIILWDISNLSAGVKKIATFKYHTREVVNVAFSPDGKLLAAASEDGKLSLWDLTDPGDNDQPVGFLDGGHTAHPRAVAFSPDGKTLASGGADSTVILWDVATRRRIGSALYGHSDWVRGVAFNNDGSRLASASSDSLVILWDVSFASWKERACNIVARNLTQVEWSSYFPDRPYEKTCEAYPPGE